MQKENSFESSSADDQGEKLRHIDVGNDRRLPDLDFDFRSKDFLTQEDIRAAAKRFAEVILGEDLVEPRLAVIDALRASNILEYARDAKPFKEEIEAALEKIKAALIEELANKIDPKRLDFVLRHVNERLIETERFFLKKGFWERGDINLSREEEEEERILSEARLQALQKLYELPERSPYIAYPILHAERNGLGVRELQNKLDFMELPAFIEQNAPSLKAVLGYVLDVMKGNLFLISHGLAASDNKLKNIAVFRAEKSGKMFDMDGLLPLGTQLSNVSYRRPSYRPLPEQIIKEKFSLEEPQIVYELGDCIAQVFLWHALGRRPGNEEYENLHSEMEKLSRNVQGVNKKLFDLGMRMQYRDPSERPMLGAAIAQFESLLEEAEPSEKI